MSIATKALDPAGNYFCYFTNRSSPWYEMHIGGKELQLPGLQIVSSWKDVLEYLHQNEVVQLKGDAAAADLGVSKVC
jgi:hypothetical protein